MSNSTRQLIEVLIALSPYVLFIAAIAWSALSGTTDAWRAHKRAKGPKDGAGIGRPA